MTGHPGAGWIATSGTVEIRGRSEKLSNRLFKHHDKRRRVAIPEIVGDAQLVAQDTDSYACGAADLSRQRALAHAEAADQT